MLIIPGVPLSWLYNIAGFLHVVSLLQLPSSTKRGKDEMKKRCPYSKFCFQHYICYGSILSLV